MAIKRQKHKITIRRALVCDLSKAKTAVLAVCWAEMPGLQLSHKDLGTLVGVSPAYIGTAKRLPKAGRKDVLKGTRPLVWPSVPKKSPPVEPVTVEMPAPAPTPAAARPAMVGVPPKANGHDTAISDALVDAVLRRAGPARVRQHLVALSMT